MYIYIYIYICIYTYININRDKRASETPKSKTRKKKRKKREKQVKWKPKGGAEKVYEHDPLKQFCIGNFFFQNKKNRFKWKPKECAEKFKSMIRYRIANGCDEIRAKMEVLFPSLSCVEIRYRFAHRYRYRYRLPARTEEKCAVRCRSLLL